MVDVSIRAYCDVVINIVEVSVGSVLFFKLFFYVGKFIVCFCYCDIYVVVEDGCFGIGR